MWYGMAISNVRLFDATMIEGYTLENYDSQASSRHGNGMSTICCVYLWRLFREEQTPAGESRSYIGTNTQKPKNILKQMAGRGVGETFEAIFADVMLTSKISTRFRCISF